MQNYKFEIPYADKMNDCAVEAIKGTFKSIIAKDMETVEDLKLEIIEHVSNASAMELLAYWKVFLKIDCARNPQYYF